MHTSIFTHLSLLFPHHTCALSFSSWSCASCSTTIVVTPFRLAQGISHSKNIARCVDLGIDGAGLHGTKPRVVEQSFFFFQSRLIYHTTDITHFSQVEKMYDALVQQNAHRVVRQDISAQVHHSDVCGHSGYHARIARHAESRSSIGRPIASSRCPNTRRPVANGSTIRVTKPQCTSIGRPIAVHVGWKR